VSEADDNIASMRKFQREVTASPEAARQALKEAGIMTDDDEIASPYRELFGLSNQDPPSVMRKFALFDVAPSAVHYAEGWLSSGYGGLFMAGWNGARYEGYAIWLRPLKAILIARDMKSRGLYRGFDLRSLSS
jgi:hypothetical protein